MNLRFFSLPLLALLLASLSNCMAPQPRSMLDLCDMFEDRRAWFKAATRAQERWGVPVPVLMSFMYQESAYRARVRPARTRLFGFIPWRRPSTAFGYSQALDGTWAEYQHEAGSLYASRASFADAVDFIGWYNYNSHRRNGIVLNDARNLYLAYHQGNTGYARGSYQGNRILLATADRVQQNAVRYQAQYNQCREPLNRNWFQRLFS